MKIKNNKVLAILLMIVMIASIFSPELMAIEFDNESTSEEGIYKSINDIDVTSRAIDGNTVEIMLTNNGKHTVSDWMVIYEADYEVSSIENAEITYNKDVIGFCALENNNILDPNESISVILEIEGFYSEEAYVDYRVYGICDQISELYRVCDTISYDANTGKTTLRTYDVDERQLVISDSISDMDNMDLNDGSSEIGTNVVIGTDGRTKVTSVNSNPYDQIACLVIKWSDGSTTIGTGFMISSQYMLTAAHNLCDSRGIVSSIKVYFGANGSSYSKVVSASSWYYNSVYISTYSAGDDWGCIKLASAPGRGYFTLGTTSASGLKATQLTVCGYPGDKATNNSSSPFAGKNMYMYKMSGYPTAVGSKIITYMMDTEGGQSGSPVYSSSNVVYGIHSQGYSGGNKAMLITSTVINYLTSEGWYN